MREKNKTMEIAENLTKHNNISVGSTRIYVRVYITKIIVVSYWLAIYCTH